MLRFLVTGLLVALPATAAPLSLAAPAPTDVTVRWEPGTPPSRFAVTWQESGDVRNRVEFVKADGGPSGDGDTIIEVGEPNRVSFPSEVFVSGVFRFRVSVIDAAGAALSEPAVSPVFDTDATPAPVLRAAVPREDGTVLLEWSPGVLPRDDTPNDPLDLPVEDPPRFIPTERISTSYRDLSPPITATRFVVPSRPMPQVVGVRATPNGWPWIAATAEIQGSRLTATVPRTATDGRALRVTGVAFQKVGDCLHAHCGTYEAPEKGRVLRLQSRTGTTAAWQVAGTTTSGEGGAFGFTVTSPGSRQYRVVAPPVAWVQGRPGRGFFATAASSTTSRPPAERPSDVDPPAVGPPAVDPGEDAGSGGSADVPLPITGVPVTALAGTGGLLVALGALLCWISRRRRTAVS